MTAKAPKKGEAKESDSLKMSSRSRTILSYVICIAAAVALALIVRGSSFK